MQRKIILSLLIAIFIAIPVVSSISSTSGEFIVNPEVVYINWTDASGLGNYSANITINNTRDYNITIEIANFTEEAILIPYFDLDTGNKNYCYFPGDKQGADDKFPCMNLSVKLPSGKMSNVFLLENKTSKNISLIPKNITFLMSYPGRYISIITIRNQTNTNENVSINVSLDIPVNFSHFNTRIVKLGEFDLHGYTMNYEIKANNQGKQDAHFYYFNPSEIDNVSAIFINVSNPNLALFLFNENETSLLISSKKGEILYSLPTLPSDYLKLYIYGNNSSDITYTSFILLFTIHALNVSDTTQNFGFNEQPFIINLSAGETNFSTQFILENKGNYSYNNVIETKYNYLIYRFSGGSNNTYSFVIPENAEKLFIELEFNKEGNYSLVLRNVSDGIVLTEYYTRTSYYEIITGNRKIISNYSSLSPGKWSIEIINISGNSPYTLNIYISLPNSLIKTNYTTKDFGKLGMENSSEPVNFTYDTNSSIPGDYLVELSYRENNGKGAGIKIPINFRILGASALINGKFKEDTISLVQNLERNITFNISFIIENYGNQNITNITIKIVNLTNGNNYVNITNIFVNDSSYNGLFTIPNNSFVEVKAEINIDTTKTKKEGIYIGYILFNMSNSSFIVVPYDYVKANIKLNLTKWLIVNSTYFSPSQVNVSFSPKNVTVSFKVYYANKSSIVKDEIALENISKIILRHKNVTSKTFDVTNSKTFSENNAQSIWYGSKNEYKFNFTVPKWIYGGYYDVLINFTTKDGKLKGEAKCLLAVEGEALAVSIISAPSSMQNGTEAWLNISITNYGINKSSNAELTIESNLISEITKLSEVSGCEKASASGKTITFTLDEQESCKIAMKIKASSSGGEGTVYLKGTSGLWIKNASFYLKVTQPSSSQTEEDSTQPQQEQEEQPQQTEENVTVWVKDIAFLQYPSLIQIKQGESKLILIAVKNTGNLTLFNLTLKVEGINKTWINVSPKTDLSPGEKHEFKVNITIPENAKIEKKTIKFIVVAKNFSKNVEATLEILPSETFKQEVEQNFTFLKQIYENLTSLYNSYKEKGLKKQEIENKLSTIETLLSQAQDLIKKNDYASAAAILSTLTNLLNETNTMVNELEKELQEKSKQKLVIIIVLIFAAIGIGFLIYLLLPPPHGYEPEKGFRYIPPHHRGKPRLKKLLDELREIKNKISEKIKRKQAIFE